MKFLKKFLIGIASLLILLLIISFFLPSKMHVEVTKDLEVSVDGAYTQVNSLKNWVNWSPWFKMDSTQKITYSGPDYGTGAMYKWESEKLGNGTMKITESKTNERIATELVFEGMSPSTSDFLFKPTEKGTSVTWTLDSDIGKNPFYKLMSVYFKFATGKDFKSGLESMEAYLKKNPQVATVYKPMPGKVEKIEERKLQAMPYLSIRVVVPTSKIGDSMGALYGSIEKTIKMQGLTMNGSPFAIYYAYDPESETDMEVGLPIDKPGKPDGRVMAKIYPATNSVAATYYGDYAMMQPAYDALSKYITDHKKSVTGKHIEFYMTDPMIEKDPAKWRTDILYPVK